MQTKEFDISTQVVRLLFLALIGSFLFLITIGLSYLASAFGAAILLAFLLSPVVNYFEGLGLPRFIGVLVIFLCFGLLVYISAVFLIPNIQKEVQELISPQKLAIADKNLHAFVRNANEFFGSAMPFFLKKKLSYNYLKGLSLNFLEGLFPKDLSFLGNFINFILVTPFILVVLLLQGDSIYKRILALVPNRYFEMALILVDNVRSQVRRYLKGLTLQWLIFGSVFSLALWIAGIPQALPLGYLAATCNIIPYVGPLLGIIPALLVTLTDPSLSVPGVLLAMGVTQLLDNIFTQPVILAGSVHLHPLIAILALITLQQYFGILGMLIAIPLASILMASIEIVYKQMKAFGII